jgi:glyoxylase I family protein
MSAHAPGAHQGGEGLFAAHHATLSVRRLEESIAFYSHLGFRQALRWRSAAGDLRIAHLTLESALLELFEYAGNGNAEPLQLAVGNDLPTVGVRHFGLQVAELQAARDYLESLGCELSPTRKGRTLIDFFYVRDPDGNWVEIVCDQRRLAPGHIIELVEGE